MHNQSNHPRSSLPYNGKVSKLTVEIRKKNNSFYDSYSCFFTVRWVLLLLRESLIQRPSLCWWLSVDQTLCHVCGRCCGQKALQPAIHHQILIRFHHRATADIWFIALGAILEFLTVNKGSLGNVNVVLFWGASVTWGRLVEIMEAAGTGS